MPFTTFFAAAAGGSRRVTYAQRRQMSSSLVALTAAVAVLTVAAPTLLPCPVAGVSKGTILGEEGEQLVEAPAPAPAAALLSSDVGPCSDAE
ncbi:hypothetical protein AMAG_20501 [Allomyces macrogynus ATCC 38327]|uniref:Uncharacterized protein n=1 Tax=Allomyces macrogynus (strain ATCC 38327) TaxID=578462 RepID=A0A0L0TDD3_ALLM3|nr:hypothetical protein AMAG_20501 [Allomyces macrogynus ATCC 38327]|eukprot:KNE72680.1 hypothetical protein AMAG_20501 [Allomyces macrogynus ATCC 38327]